MFQAVPRDMLTASPPQLSLNGRPSDTDARLANVLMATVQAVPAFRRLMLQATGAAGAAGGMDDVFVDVRLPNEVTLTGPISGFIAAKNAANSALLLVKAQNFSAADPREVARIAETLTIARDRKIGRVISVSSLVPSQSLLAAVKGHALSPGLERLKSLTWMGMTDLAIHLLERKVVRSTAEIFLLQQFIRYVREEAVRDRQARLDRPEGALYFHSLGEDWRALAQEFAREGTVDAKDPRLVAVAANWLAFLRFAALSLSGQEDLLAYPNVRKPLGRVPAVARRLKDDGQLLATFARKGDKSDFVLSVDLKRQQVVFQMEVPGPGRRTLRIADLAHAVREDRTVGETRIKIFWPGERQPRPVTRRQAASDAIATAPPQHGLVPDRFIIERIIRAETIMGEPDSLAQLLMLELRGFRASVRQVLRRGPPLA